MSEPGATFRYRVNEFAIESNFALVADASVVAPGKGVPLSLRRESLAEVPSLLRKLRRQITYDVGSGLLIEPRSTLALLVDYRADHVSVDCADEALDAASAWLWNVALGCRTILRGGLPIHAAGVEIAGQYVGIMATSGSGKSTLTHYLLESGAARFGNDDLIPVYIENGAATAFPSVSLYPKIGEDIALRSGLDLSALLRADSDPNRAEYYVPLASERRMLAPAPLSALFRLEPDDAATGATCERIPDAVPLLSSELHSHWVLGKYLNGAKIHRRVQSLADAVLVYRVTYRRDFDVLPVLAETMARTVAGGAA